MKRAVYIPDPVDTSNIELPPSLEPLMELVARNTHEVWAKQRISEGWTYGEKRDDALKHSPDLVPYECLSDSEKEYDRKTSAETLKLILTLGFDIVRRK